MVLRQDIWTHDTCLVCQSLHATKSEKEKHEEEDNHKNKTVVYDFLSKELSCLTASNKHSVLYQRYYRANAAIAGLDCICELNFAWSPVPFWACTICYVAGKSLESADDHMYSSFHKRNYLSEYYPDRYSILLRVQEKSTKNKQSLLEHEAILEILNESKGLMKPDVYEISERDRQWAFQKLGLMEEDIPPNYISEEISENHQIVLCKICCETFMAYTKEDSLREAWFTHLSTNNHQRCKFMQILIHEDKLKECEGIPTGFEVRKENKFEVKAGEQDNQFYGPTVGLEFLVMFNGSEESFCKLCFCCVPNMAIIDHFSSEYHTERFVKRDGPGKLHNSEYLKLEEIHEILTYCFDEKPVTVHKYNCLERQFPLLLRNYAFPERRSIVAYDIEQIDFGHNIKAVWCEECKEYVHMNEPDAWNIHIFDDQHHEQSTRKSLHYIGDEGLIKSNIQLDEFTRSTPPVWEDHYSISLGVLTVQDHCEYGQQFIIRDELRNKLLCTCCFVTIDCGDASMFSFHARSLQHITRAMNSMNKKTMITLAFRFPDINSRKPLIMDYFLHSQMNLRKQKQGISVYDPIIACQLNCISSVPNILLELAKTIPEERIKFLERFSFHDEGNKQNLFVPLNNALRLCKIEMKFWDKEMITFHCQKCIQSFSASEKNVNEELANHLLSSSHWERTKIFDENPFDENQRLSTKVSKIKVASFQQPNGKKKVTWKWNDKKSCYEFVYTQLGLRDIRERRNFNGATKPDFFCSLCAQSFKANRLDLEQHIRSFSHIFYYMHKYQPIIIPEMQAELLNSEITITEKHKNIRRLFARAVKGIEKTKSEDIPIYDFEHRECEYADIKAALAEDCESDDVKVPTQQRNVINIFDQSLEEENEQQLLNLNAIRSYGKRKQRNIEEIIKKFSLLIEADDQIRSKDSTEQSSKNNGETTGLMFLERATKQLLNVIHFDGMVETAETTQTQPTLMVGRPISEQPETPKAQTDDATAVDSVTIDNNLTPTSSNSTNRSHIPQREKDGQQNHRTRSRSRDRARNTSRERTRSKSRGRSPRSRRRYSRSPQGRGRRSNRSKSVNRQRRSPSQSSKRRSKSPPTKRARSKSQHRESFRAKSPTAAVKSPEKRQPVIYTSYAKRLADLKAALLERGGSKQILTGDSNHYVFQSKSQKPQNEKDAITNANKELMPPKPVSPLPPPPVQKPPEREGGFFTYIPPPPPSYATKNVGGAYDPGYLEKTFPHLLRKSVSPPRGNLEDLTSARVRKPNQHTQSPRSSNVSPRKRRTKTRSPSEKRMRRSRSSSAEPKEKNSKHAESSHSSDSESESSSTSESFDKERTNIKQQLLNRLMNEKKDKVGKKIQMHIPKELPAFKQQALRRQLAQEKAGRIQQHKKQFYRNPMGDIKIEQDIEEGRLQSISPEPDDIVVVDQQQQKQPESTAGNGQLSKTSRISRWNLVDGKFIPADSSTTPTTSVAQGNDGSKVDVSTTAGSQIPKVDNIEPPKLVTPIGTPQQQAQNVLTQMASSTAAFRVAQSPLTHNVVRIGTTQQGISIPPPPLNQSLGQTSVQQQQLTSAAQSIIGTPTTTLPTSIGTTTPLLYGSQPASLLGTPTMTTPPINSPLLGANTLPQSLLGTLTSALGVRSALAPTLASIPPPNLTQPPPFMMPPVNQPPPTFDRGEMIMRQKTQYYATLLEKITSIQEFIEFMWKQCYDPIPPTDPPLLFNEVLKKRKALIGANTLYQIICYGHPELETYYCGMCNHWTTVSEMFMHLRAPMHQLNYMFRNYKMYHRKAMEEQDEQRRDVMLQRFAQKIWEVEHSGQCTNRMRLVLNEGAIRQIWPDYINCIDNSWKIMDDDDIEFLDDFKSHSAASDRDHGSRPNSLPKQPNIDMDMDRRDSSPPSAYQFADQSAIRAESVNVRAKIVAKKLELAEKTGKLPGLVKIRPEILPQEGSLLEADKDSQKGKAVERRKSRPSEPESRRRSRSRSRVHTQRSRSKSPANRSTRERERERERGSRRRSRSRTKTSKRSKSRNTPPPTTENAEKQKEKPIPEQADEGVLSEKMAQFLHKIGDRKNASKVYWQMQEGQDQIMELERQNYSNLPVTPPVQLSLADRLASSSESILRRHQINEAEKEQLSREFSLSPERPAITPISQSVANKQQQANAKTLERERAMEDQKKMKRALGAMVELQQEFENNGHFLTADTFFDICQQFGIQPDEVLKIDILCNGANAFRIDIQGAYPHIIKRMHQKGVHPTTHQHQSQPNYQQQTQAPSIQQQFNLQSMGVDTSKLRGLDSRMLQSILSKANASAGVGTTTQDKPPIPGRSRMEAHEIQLDESLAPGNYVYPSYEEQQQQSTSTTDVDSNISRLTYAFGQPPTKPMEMEDTSAEVTLAVQASTRNALLPRHPQSYVRQGPPHVEQRAGPMGYSHQMMGMAQTPPIRHFPEAQTENPIDFTEDTEPSYWSPKPIQRQGIAEPSQSPFNRGVSQFQSQMPRPPPAMQPYQRSPSVQSPMHPGSSPLSRFQQQSPAMGVQATGTPPSHIPPAAAAQSPQQGQGPNLRTQPPKKQLDPNLQKLAKEVGDDWGSLGSSLDSLFGLGSSSLQQKGSKEKKDNK